MYLLHRLRRIQEGGFTRARCAASHIDPGHRPGFSQYDGATGRPLGQGMMADLDAVNRG